MKWSNSYPPKFERLQITATLQDVLVYLGIIWLLLAFTPFDSV